MCHRITVTQRIGAISAVGQNKVQFTAEQKDQRSPATDLENWFSFFIITWKTSLAS